MGGLPLSFPSVELIAIFGLERVEKLPFPHLCSEGVDWCPRRVSNPTSCNYCGGSALICQTAPLLAQCCVVPLPREESPYVVDFPWESSASTIVRLLGDALDTSHLVVFQRRPEYTTERVPVGRFLLCSVSGAPASRSLPQPTFSSASHHLLVADR